MNRAWAIALALAVAAPARAKERFAVTFINIGQPAAYWDVFTAAARASAAQLEIDLEVLDAHGDHLRMIELAQQIAARKVHPAYALINNEKGAAGRMLEALAAAKVPTLLVGSVFDEKELQRYGHPREKFPTFLGMLEPDNAAAGAAMAQALIEAGRAKFSGPMPLLAISGARATRAAAEREAGLGRTVAAANGVQLEQLVHSAWLRDKAHRQLAGLLRRWPRTRLIWAANDPMALGALDALRERGAVPGRDALVVGLNLSADALQAVREGSMVASVGGHFLGGAWALVLLRDLHDGFDFAREGLEQKFLMGTVDRSNVDAYLARMGDQRWDRIDFRRFSRSYTPRLARHEFSLQKAASSR
jgi:ABC-type sugar transport system substrate-binding protein